MAIKYEKRDQVAYITLNNPEKANILDKATSDEISAAWIDLWEDRDIRCAILTGAGDRHFCGGHNLAKTSGHHRGEERANICARNGFSGRWRDRARARRPAWMGGFGDHYPRVWKPQ